MITLGRGAEAGARPRPGGRAARRPASSSTRPDAAATSPSTGPDSWSATRSSRSGDRRDAHALPARARGRLDRAAAAGARRGGARVAGPHRRLGRRRASSPRSACASAPAGSRPTASRSTSARDLVGVRRRSCPAGSRSRSVHLAVRGLGAEPGPAESRDGRRSRPAAWVAEASGLRPLGDGERRCLMGRTSAHEPPPRLTGCGSRSAPTRRFRELRSMVSELRLNTVCQEARCPQHLRVLERGHGDLHDPGRHLHAALRVLQRQQRAAERRASIATSRRTSRRRSPASALTHAVITSVDRDDLPDGGAAALRRRRRRHPRAHPDVRRRGAHPRLQEKAGALDASSTPPRGFRATTSRRCRACTRRRGRDRATPARSACWLRPSSAATASASPPARRRPRSSGHGRAATRRSWTVMRDLRGT